jgi:peptidoglycan/LPS O-acetylase OafA/YrhL
VGEVPAAASARHWRRDTLATSSSPLGAATFPGLDLLRGFAAVSVVVYHAIELFSWSSFPRDNPVALWFRAGGLSVDLFYVISGLVITLSLLKQADRDPVGYRRTYLRRRLARIVPLHYLTCVAYVILIVPAILKLPSLPSIVLRYVTFTHNWSPSTLGLINGQNWSLGVEMQFYLLLLLATPLLRRVHPLSLLLVLIPASWLWRAAAFGHYCGQFQSWLNMTWFSTLQLPGALDEFAFGIALAIAIHRDRQGRLVGFLHRTRWALPLLTALLIRQTMRILFAHGQFWTDPDMVIFWRTMLGASWAVLVVTICAIDDAWFVRLTGPLRYLGTISYGIYLWHSIVIALVKPHLSWNPALACASTLGLTILLASLSWHGFEKRLLDRFAGTSGPSSASGPAAQQENPASSSQVAV